MFKGGTVTKRQILHHHKILLQREEHKKENIHG